MSRFLKNTRATRARAAAALGLGLAGLAGQAGAQRPDSTRADTLVSTIQEIVVEARKPVTTVGGAAAVELRVDSLRLAPAPTLELLLREMPALHVRRNSRGEAEISARGSDSRQVAVLVDGIPLTLAWDGRADVSVIPATAPQRIEYTRGLSSVLAGPNVLGGVVEISVGRSLLQPSAPVLQLTTGFDHAGGVGSAATASVPFENAGGRWLIRGGAAFRDTPGQPLAAGVVEPLPRDDALRVNTDARHVDGFASVRYHSNTGAWFSASGSVFDAERGIAAELGVDNARYWRYPNVSRTVGVVSAGTGDREALFGGRGDLELSVGFDAGRTDIDSYTGRDYTTTASFDRGRDRTLTLRVLGDHTLGERGELRTSVTTSSVRHDESLPNSDARYRQQFLSMGTETVWRLVENDAGMGSLRLSVGGAFDLARTPETGGRPSLGTRTAWGGRIGFTGVLPDGSTLVHGGVSRRARFPSLRELYSGALDRFAPNPALRPENLVAMEAGVTRRIGRGDVQAVAFRHQMNDAVVRVTLPDLRFMRVNRDRLTSTGLELLATVPIGPATLSTDLTLQSVSLTDTDAGETNRPENLPEVFGSIRARAPIALGVSGGVEARYTGSQFCIDPGTGLDTALEGGAVFNADLSRAWPLRGGTGGIFRRIETSLAVENLGSRALYDQCGLPEPGRLLRVQVRVF